MESNKDEALRALAIAQKHRNAGNLPSARKFAQKSIALFSTPEAVKLLSSLDSEGSSKASTSDSKTSSGPSSFTSGAESHPSASTTKQRHATSPSSANGSATSSEKAREYTAENMAVVKRVRACKITEYYEILALSKDCEEADVKKAYRKLALALHPDKNGAPGADEAFKMVSKAFQILSDPQKRAAFDRHGSDPEARFGSGPPSSSGGRPGFATTPFANGNGFEGEMSPEDLFNMFFGGGMGPGGFSGGPVFSASFGPGGFRTTRVYTNGRPQQNQAAQDSSPRSVLLQLMPLLILFAFSFLTAIPSLFGTPPTPDPRFSFSPSTRYNMQRETSGLKIPFYVNSAEFSGHPIAADIARTSSEQGKKGPTPKSLRNFEDSVDKSYVNDKYRVCREGLDRKQRRKDEAIGFFGIGADWDKVKKIEEEKVDACETLKSLGYLQ